MTWESLSGWLQGPKDAMAWEAVIPSMGYMALLRNLRNFHEVGVSGTVLDSVATKLADPVGGLTDAGFRMISLLESGVDADWLWPTQSVAESGGWKHSSDEADE